MTQYIYIYIYIYIYKYIYIFVVTRHFSLGPDRRYLAVLAPGGGTAGPDASPGGPLDSRETSGIATDWVTRGLREIGTH